MQHPPPRSKRPAWRSTLMRVLVWHLLFLVVLGTAPSISALLLLTNTRQSASRRFVSDRNVYQVNVDDHLDDHLGGEASLYLTDTSSTTERTTNEEANHSRPRIAILRYSDHWVCINKPVGLTVHRGSIDHTQPINRQQQQTKITVVSTLKRQLRRKVWPVHRLDHRTSGAMLLAFDSTTAAKLQKALRESSKLYIALLRGEWKFDESSVTIDQPITHDGVTKEALTIFHKLADLNNDEYDKEDDVNIENRQFSCNRSCTLVLAEPVTGRTHQIRRHAARHLSMPVLGDTQHGDTKVNRYWRLKHQLNRLALHSFAIKNLGTDADCVLDITAPIPDDLRKVLQSLEPLWKVASAVEPRLATGWIDERGGTLGDRKDWQRVREVNPKDGD